MGIINYTRNKMSAKTKTIKTPKTVSKKSSKGSKKSKFGRTYKQMIKDVLISSNDRKGLSASAIKARIKDIYHNEVAAKPFNNTLKSLVASSSVTQKKGHYKMTRDQKVNKEKIAKKKAAAARTKARKDAKKAKNKIKKQAKKDKAKTKKKAGKKNNKKKNEKNR